MFNNYFNEIHEDLYSAIRDDDLDKIKTLIDQQPEIINEKSMNDTPYLFDVIRFCSFETFLYFIYKNCDLKQTNEYNNTALHKAAYYNNTKVMKYLLRKGLVDINAQDELGYSALHHAAYNNNMESCVILLQFRINKQLKHIYGFTAYDVAFKNGRYQSADLIKGFDEKEEESLNHLIEVENEELQLEDDIRKEENIEKAKMVAEKMTTREREVREFRKTKEKEAKLKTQLLESSNVIVEEQEKIKFIKKKLKKIEKKEKDLDKSYKNINKELRFIEKTLEDIDQKHYQKCEICERVLSSANGIFRCMRDHKVCQECKENRLIQCCPFCEENAVIESIKDTALDYLLKL